MAQRLPVTFIQHFSATPAVRSGAKLFFYEAGTTTKADTYSDKTRTTANSNPIILDSLGQPAVAIFLQDILYDVVLAESTDTDPPASPIWTAEDVQSSDFDSLAIWKKGSGAPTGVVAGTQGSATTLPTVYWDYTNAILYLATTTGTAATAVWTALNASTPTAFTPFPTGRLTLSTGAATMPTTVSAATAVYYTPYVGVIVPIYTGSAYGLQQYSELTLTLVASHTANSIYDVFAINNAGVVTLVTGPAWTTGTAGAGDRGTGAGTTQLTRLSGLWVNAVSMTGRNGSSTYTIAANLATYLGTIHMSSTNGQTQFIYGVDAAGGTPARFGVWNAYNRVPLTTQFGDTLDRLYQTATWRSWAGGTAGTNCAINFIRGLAEDAVDAWLIDLANIITQFEGGFIGINLNSVTATPSYFSYLQAQAGTSTVPGVAHYAGVPAIGYHYLAAMQRGDGGAGGVTFQSTPDMMFGARLTY